MAQRTNSTLKNRRLGFGSVALIGLLTLICSLGFAADKKKPETIRATAMGTGTQMGQNANVGLIIFNYSLTKTGRPCSRHFSRGRLRR